MQFTAYHRRIDQQLIVAKKYSILKITKIYFRLLWEIRTKNRKIDLDKEENLSLNKTDLISAHSKDMEIRNKIRIDREFH
jgi:hypothetical protein